MNIVKTMLLLMTFGIFSCTEREMDNAAQLTIEMRGNTQSTGNERIADDLEIAEAYFGVTKIEFEHESDNHEEKDDDLGKGSDDESMDDEFEIELKGRYVVDLIEGKSSPSLPSVSLTPGFYNEIKVDLSPILEGNYSVILKGNYTDDQGANHLIELFLNQPFEIKIENHNGFNLDSEKLNQILLLFDLEAWFSDIKFDNMVEDDGVIRITVELNEHASSQVQINIGKHCKGGFDDDGDDQLDDH